MKIVSTSSLNLIVRISKGPIREVKVINLVVITSSCLIEENTPNWWASCKTNHASRCKWAVIPIVAHNCVSDKENIVPDAAPRCNKIFSIRKADTVIEKSTLSCVTILGNIISLNWHSLVHIKVVDCIIWLIFAALWLLPWSVRSAISRKDLAYRCWLTKHKGGWTLKSKIS